MRMARMCRAWHRVRVNAQSLTSRRVSIPVP
jgi:hypothetical protein